MKMILFMCMILSITVSAQDKNSESEKEVPVINAFIDANLYVQSNNMIEIDHYYVNAKVYHIKRPEYPSANELYVRAGDLVDAIKTLDKKKVFKNPKAIIGNMYSLDKDVVLIERKSTENSKAKKPDLQKMASHN